MSFIIKQYVSEFWLDFLFLMKNMKKSISDIRYKTGHLVTGLYCDVLMLQSEKRNIVLLTNRKVLENMWIMEQKCKMVMESLEASVVPA